MKIETTWVDGELVIDALASHTIVDLNSLRGNWFWSYLMSSQVLHRVTCYVSLIQVHQIHAKSENATMYKVTTSHH